MGIWSQARLVACALGALVTIQLTAACSSDVADEAAPSERVAEQSQALTAPAWQVNKAYSANTVVSYQGKLYRCIQAHTSASGWEPPNVPALWSFEGNDTGSNVNTGPTGPNGPITLDYVTLQADCDSFPDTCCAAGSTKTSLTAGNDVRTFSGSNECIMSLAGSDTLTVTASGKSSLNLGPGNDTAMDGPGDNFIWGGFGDDTINGFGGTNLFFGGWGNDTIKAANGTNTVVPGPGVDTVALGTGDDTVYLFDACEVVSGKKLDAGTGFDTLYTPMPLADLRARGMTVDNFERIIVVDNHCRSQCGNHVGCSVCSSDDDKDGTFNCQDECPLDPAKTTPGLCNCGVSDVDSDGDQVPDCMDECPLDGQTAYRGVCRCPHDAAPNGTVCTDGVTPGAATCNNGICGNPSGSLPQAGCFVKTDGWHAYWFCPAATQSQAATRCTAVTGRKLIQIDDRNENAFAAKFVTGESWIGAVDRTTEGEWSWLDATNKETKKFWTGGASGKAFKGLYQSFLGGNPGTDTSKNCGTLSLDRAWRSANCADSRPYVCEGLFGPGSIPGSGVAPPQPLGPAGIIPGWNSSSNCGTGPGCNPGNHGDGSDIVPPLCTPEPKASDILLQKQQIDACALHCSEGSVDKHDETTCRTVDCKDAAAPPAAGQKCSANGEPLGHVVLPPGLVGKCSVQNQDCSSFKFLGIVPTQCGVQTQCYDRTRDAAGVWVTHTCAEGCRAGTTCETASGKCVNANLKGACDPATIEPATGLCQGECVGQIGCGLPNGTLADAGSEECSETRWCGPDPYDAPLNTGSNLDDKTPWSDGVLPDLTSTPPPPFSTDFNQPCTGTCAICLGDHANDPACLRASRHNWCNFEQTTVGAPDAAVNDGKSGSRGDTSKSVIKFSVDPGADLDFNVKPLPFGVSDFNVLAAASIRTTADFNFAGLSGTVELVDLRGALTASLCQVATDSSHIEVLGIDFLPTLLDEIGAKKVIFNTDKDWSGADACKKAVATYVDAVDRAKKALRDAQDLVTQFNTLKNQGHTFNATTFCNTVAGTGMRPPGMPGSCATESPADTVNAFIAYYKSQADKVGPALDTLSRAVLNSSSLAQILGFDKGSGFEFFAPIGDATKGAGGKESTTLVTVQFFIGPVPCNLELTSFMDYGIMGGFGANLEPSALISGGGPFAKAGAVITPYADAGVTLFVGVGFSVPGFSVKLGIEGAVTLGNVNVPATVAAGLSLTSERDDRPLPADISGLSNGEVLFPRDGGGPRKYNFQFDYSYGVTLTVNNILDGHIDAALKIKFLFFSKKWSKQIVSFKSGLSIGPTNLIGGGSYDDATKKHQVQVPSDTKTWKSTYASVPFMALNNVSMPLSPVFDGSYSPLKSSELFYDSLCKCEDNGAACFRDADCCDSTSTCFEDPAQNNKHVCRECGKPNNTDTCKTDKDCCPGAICSQADVEVCVTDPSLCPPGSSGTGGTGGTNGQPCIPIRCTTLHPATPVCQSKPGDPTK
jgi:Ca2+-binding RTX toxin-like protein